MRSPPGSGASRHMARRLALALAIVLAMLTAASFVLRLPDLGEVIVFFTGGIPSLVAGEAVMTSLAWLVIALTACAIALSLPRNAAGSRLLRGFNSYASLLLVVGLLLLVVSAIRHALPAASVCCGSGAANLREALNLAR